MVIDCLLLRNLPCGVSRIRCNESVLTHLIAGDGVSESFDKPRDLSGIPPLVHEPSNFALFQQCLGSPPDLLQHAVKGVNRCSDASNRRAYLVNSLRRSVSPGSSSTAVVITFCLNLSNWGFRSSILSLRSSNSCERPCQFCTTATDSTNTS